MKNFFFNTNDSKHTRALIIFIIFILGGIFTDLLIYQGFHPLKLPEQIVILFTTGFALLLLDYPYFRHATSTRKILLSLTLVCLGIVLLTVVVIFRHIDALQPMENTLPNILVALGLVVLLLAAYIRSTTQPTASTLTRWFWLIALSGLAFWFSHDLFNYMLVCATSLMTGKGLSRLLGESAINKRSLRAFITLIFWSILIGVGVGIGIPMKIWSIVIWVLTIGLALWGMKQPDQEPFFEQTDLLNFLLPLLIVFPYTIYGFSNYAGNPSLDGWNYIASGQTLWENSRCATDVVLPMYKFGIVLSCATRYMSFGFLSFFSYISGTPGDTQISVNIYIPWLFFMYTTALRFFAESRKESDRVVKLYIVLGALAGWPLKLMVANNFDNLLVVSYLPFISGLTVASNFSHRWNILMGVIIATVLYGYPELAPFIFFAVGLLIIERWLVLRSNTQKFIGAIATILITSLLITIPYIQTAITFFVHQVLATANTSQEQILPGGSFASELLHADTWFIALWGMTGTLRESPFVPFFDAIRMIFAIGFLLSLIVGMIVLWRKREFALLACFAFFASGTAYYLVAKQYSYAGYKLLNLSWWLSAYLILTGCLTLYRRFTFRLPGKQWMFGALTCLYILWCFIIGQNLYLAPVRQMALYRNILDMPIGKEQTLLLATRNDRATLWAMYYLRNRPVIYDITTPTNVASFTSNVAMSTLASQSRYLLIDKTVDDAVVGKIVWKNSVYKLIKLSPNWIWLQKVDNPNRVKISKGKHSFWMGGAPTKLVVESSIAQNIRITFRGTPGPGLPETQQLHLRIVSGNFDQVLLIKNGKNRISIPMHAGINTISLQIVEPPTVLTIPNDDIRPVMLTVSNLEIKK